MTRHDLPTTTEIKGDFSIRSATRTRMFWPAKESRVMPRHGMRKG